MQYVNFIEKRDKKNYRKGTTLLNNVTKMNQRICESAIESCKELVELIKDKQNKVA
jgi:hypothetical protein